MLRRLLPFSCLVFTTWCAGQAETEPLLGTVVAPDGTPVAGARVEVWRAEGRGMNMLDLAYSRTYRRIAVVPSDRHGRFAVHLPIGLPCRVRVDHAPYAIWLREDFLAGEDVPVQLGLPAVFEGKLTLADGSPATAELRAWNRDTSDEVLRGRTDEDGHFRFARVAAGSIRVEVSPDAAPSPSWADLELEAGETVTHDVQLARGVRLHGRVVDAETGEPISGARIGEGCVLHRGVTTRTDGGYERLGYGSPGHRELHCVAAGYVKQVVKPNLGEHDLTVDFRLERGLGAAGRVVGTDGEPLPDTYVQVFGTVHDGTDQFHDCIGLRTDAEGRFRTRGLRADLDHVLVVRRDGYATLVYVLPPADASGTKVGTDIRLSKPRFVRGVVRDAKGEPLPYTRVSLWGYNSDRFRFDPHGGLATHKDDANYGKGWGLLDMYVGRHSLRTDHKGRFVFGAVPPGEFHITTSGDKNARTGNSAKFKVTADSDPEPIEVVVDR